MESEPNAAPAPASTSVSRPPLLRRADFWAGLLCLGFGIGFVWIGADYPLGTGGRIGPGYAPRLLGLLLIGLGALLALRAPWTADGIETTFRPRPVLLVLASVLAFALVFQWAGLVPAILASVFIATWAAPENGWQSAIGLGVLLAVFSWALFVKALRLPIPVFWF